MSEEQMNKLINVLNRIGDELQISNISQPNRKHMRQLLKIRKHIKSYDDQIERIEKRINKTNADDYDENPRIQYFLESIDRAKEGLDRCKNAAKDLENILMEDIHHCDE